MKRLPVLLLAAVGSAGCFASVRVDPHPAQIEARSTDLSVQVLPADPLDDRMRTAASSLAHDLRLTGLFSRVATSHDSTSDLTVVVRHANGIARCGTPRIMSMLTLGLVPGRTDYFYYYDFDLVPRDGPLIPFEQRYPGEMLFGAWAIPKRVSAHWSRIPTNHAPSAVVQRLRADLLTLQPRLPVPAVAHVDPSTRP